MFRISILVLLTITGLACGDQAPPTITIVPPIDAPPTDQALPDSDPSVTLTVVMQGTGAGTVTSDLGGIECGAACTAELDQDAVVTLTATADDSSLFAGWGGACSGTDPCVVTTDRAKTVSASFMLPHLVVSFDTRDGTGTISSDRGLACNGTCEADFPRGTVITLTGNADPSSNSAFATWSDPSCTGTSCTLVLTAATTTIGARFTRDNSVDNGVATFTATKHGTPAWDVTGFQIASIYDNNNFLGNVLRLWEHHGFNTALNSPMPNEPHGPPYDTEVVRRFAELGWDSGDRFRVVDWSSQSTTGCAAGCNIVASTTGTSAGRMLLFAGVIVPNADAPIGSTRDYASGPIIPRDLGLVVDADLLLADVVVDPDFDGPYPTLAQLDPMATEDGESHKTLTFADGDQYIPAVPGNYRLHVHVFESATPSNGWDVEIPFVVAP